MANSYTGETLIAEGMLVVSADQALGTTAGVTTVAAGGTLAFRDGVHYTAAEIVRPTGSGSTGDGAVLGISGHNTFSGILDAVTDPLTIGSLDDPATAFSDTFTVTTLIDLELGSLVVGGSGTTVIAGGITGDGSGPAPATYRDFATALGAVGYYSFDNVAGNTVSNQGSSGATHNGTFTDGATQTTGGRGILGEAMSVNDNSNHRLTLANGGIDIGPTGWTAGGWFYDLHPIGAWRTLFRGGSNDHQVIIQDSAKVLGSYDNANGGFRPGEYSVGSLEDDGQWHHLIARGNPGPDGSAGSTTDLFIDGVWVGQTDRRSVTEITAIGNHTGGGQPFAQLVDEMVVFNRALSDRDIRLLASPAVPDHVVKIGSGTLILESASDYVGTTDVQAGVVRATHPFGLGTTAGQTVVAGGATLALSGGVSIDEPVTATGTGAAGMNGCRVQLRLGQYVRRPARGRRQGICHRLGNRRRHAKRHEHDRHAVRQRDLRRSGRHPGHRQHHRRPGGQLHRCPVHQSGKQRDRGAAPAHRRDRGVCRGLVPGRRQRGRRSGLQQPRRSGLGVPRRTAFTWRTGGPSTTAGPAN